MYLLDYKITNLTFCCDTDINECLNKTICENGECTNLEGSFKCSCNEGYQHSMDGPKMCLGEFIVFTITKGTLFVYEIKQDKYFYLQRYRRVRHRRHLW